MNTISKITLLTTLACSAVAHAGSSSTVTAKLTADIPTTTSYQEVVKAIEAAIKSRGVDVNKNIGLLPNPLPVIGGQPISETKSINIMGNTFSYPVTTCPNSYGMITGGQTSGRAGFAADGESYIACIYPYTEGAKVYLIGVYSKSSNDGIDGWLADKIRKAVRGEDDQAYAKMFKDMLAKIKSGVNNNIAFEQIEWPDGGVEHPDIVSDATKKT